MIISIAVKEWKLLLKEKGTFFWLLLLPILFIVIFGSIFGNIGSSAVTIPYIDMDRTAASQSFLDSLTQKGGYELSAKEPSQLDDQVKRIRDGNQSALLVVPQGFADRLKGEGGAQASVELYGDSASEIVAPLQATLENIANGMRETKIENALKAAGDTDAQASSAMTSPLRIELKAQNVQADDALTSVVPGYTVMFVFYVIVSMIRRFIGDKSNGMTARLRTTRMTPLGYLLGMWLAYLVVALAQSAVLLSFGHFVYGLQISDFGTIAAIVVVLAVCGTGIGLAVCMLVRGENQGMGVTQLIALGGAVLGGLWVPIDLMPKTVQLIGHFVPQYWAQQAFKDVMARGQHLADILPQLAALAGFAALGLLVALLRFRSFMKSALD